MSKTKLVIIGAGRFGAETLELAKQIGRTYQDFQILGFLDDYSDAKAVSGYPVLGGFEKAKSILDEETDIRGVVAIGDTKIKQKVAKQYQKIGLQFTNLIHPTVISTDSVTIGTGCIITANCIFTVDIEIGNHVILNLATTVGHDSVIGNFTTVNPQVAINGKDRIGKGVYIGTGATLIHNVSIGDWSLIGAGATVVNDIPPGVLAVGIPAKPIKKSPYV